MSSRPDLFVICKSCGSEVSPYVTECPYCGKRLRKRAPKIERGSDGPARVRRPRLRRWRSQPDSPRLSRLRAGEIPGIRGDESKRPLATIALVVAGLVFLVLFQAEILVAQTLGLTPLTDLGVSSQGWRLVTSLFIYSSVVAQFTTLLVVAVFGWLLERRHGFLLVLVLFFAAGVAGNVAASALNANLTLGGGGGALALLAAWALPVVRARRRDGGEDEADLLGTAVLAAMLVVLAVVVDFASPVATAVGGLVGVLAGLVLGALRPR
ncbi:MAG TPA: rhomboid family intramembrane serine protease [Solirubrobacteraceae bacterium]|nr:rhomboid family intramembrane serine protease [Solirubrobacteraceae bacterium]